MHVERELQDLRERLARVDEWKARRDEIEKELAQVWVEGGEALQPPPSAEGQDGEGGREAGEEVGSSGAQVEV